MDYSKECWNCHNSTMQPVKTWYACSNCGTTWVPQPTLRQYDDIGRDRRGQGGTSSHHLVKKSGRVKGGPALPPLLRPSDKDYGKQRRRR